MYEVHNNRSMRFMEEVVVGLTVSAVALSLGGAFGVLSGRGVLVGMLSAAIFPLITSLCGGTRVQCSGPTGPMTTAFIAVMSGAAQQLGATQEALVPMFLNMTIFLTALLLVIGGLLRLGNWVQIVPHVVISGFMNGIALIIWISQGKKLLQIGTSVIEGSLGMNCVIAAATVAIAIAVQRATKILPSRLAGLLSGTLIALISMTVLCALLDLPVDRASPDLSLRSWGEVSAFTASHSPTLWPWHLFWLALPWALQLAAVAYLDTLLTSLIIDRQRKEQSRRNQELGAQGLATGVMALIGGIPGAQATERSVLLIKEGARSRLAGICVGLFGLVGVLLLQDVVASIPKAVFAGILLKVGYDVFDWQPIRMYLRQFASNSRKLVTHGEMVLITGTALLTLFVNLTTAVVAGTLAFLLLRKYGASIHDLRRNETEGLTDEP